MFVEFTEQEKAEIISIEEKYEKAFKAIDEILNSRKDEPPEFLQYIEYPEKPTKAEFERIKKENEAISAANEKAYKEWEAAGTPEWREARAKWDEINKAFNEERAELFRRAEERQFKALGNDPVNIFEDAKKQVKKAIQSQYQYYKDLEKQGSFSSVHVCALEDGTWLLDEGELRVTINGTIRRHIEVLKQYDGFITKLNQFIDKTLKGNKYVAPPGHPGKFAKVNPLKPLMPAAMVTTKYPVNFDLGQYMKLPQDNHTNNLAHKLTTKVKDPAQLDLTGKATIAQLDLTGKATIASQDFRLYIEGYGKLVNGANTSAVKLFDAFVMVCSRDRNPLARIPLKEYMELRGLKDEKEARKQIKANMEVLKSIKLEYKGTGKSRGDWLSLSLYGGRAGIYRGVIEFRFTPEFYASIPENQFMFIPKEYFSTRDRYNPHTAYFIRRIAEHKRMNLGKPNENIIGVETLVNSSPTFPKYEDVNYRFTQFILEPFERDMDAIQSIKWHYAGEQPTNYNEFITSNVVITWVDYPDDEVKKITQRKKHSAKGKKTHKKKGG